jgi:hypothetical protein
VAHCSCTHFRSCVAGISFSERVVFIMPLHIVLPRVAFMTLRLEDMETDERLIFKCIVKVVGGACKPNGENKCV